MKKTYITPAFTIMELTIKSTLLQASSLNVDINNDEDADAGESLIRYKEWDYNKWGRED